MLWNSHKIKAIMLDPERRTRVQVELSPKEILFNHNGHLLETIVSALVFTTRELVSQNEQQAQRILKLQHELSEKPVLKKKKKSKSSVGSIARQETPATRA